MRLVALFIGLLACFTLRAQQDAKTLRFELKFGASPFQLGENFALGSDSVQFENLKFYLSNIQFYRKGKLLYQHPKQYHLVDASDSSTWHLPLADNSPAFDAIQFNLGIDSLTNVSGAMAGDLDPTKNMYWTWQSGYINFKLEGYSPKCPARNHFFQYHIGGYAAAQNSLQHIHCGRKRKGASAVVQVQVAKFMQPINLAEVYEIMSPGPKAVALSRTFVELFSLK